MKTIVGYFGVIVNTLTHKLVKQVLFLNSKDRNAIVLYISKTYNFTELSVKKIHILRNESRFTLNLLQKIYVVKSL